MKTNTKKSSKDSRHDTKEREREKREKREKEREKERENREREKKKREEEQIQIAREKNRAAAYKCRQRKLAVLDSLYAQNEQLDEANYKLREKVASLEYTIKMLQKNVSFQPQPLQSQSQLPIQMEFQPQSQQPLQMTQQSQLPIQMEFQPQSQSQQPYPIEYFMNIDMTIEEMNKEMEVEMNKEMNKDMKETFPQSHKELLPIGIERTQPQLQEAESEKVEGGLGKGLGKGLELKEIDFDLSFLGDCDFSLPSSFSNIF